MIILALVHEASSSINPPMNIYYHKNSVYFSKGLYPESISVNHVKGDDCLWWPGDYD